MMSKMSPADMERMSKMAAGMGMGPSAGAGMGGMGGMPTMTPEMLKQASDMMSSMKPEDMQRMTEMAASMGMGPGSGTGGCTARMEQVDAWRMQAGRAR